MKKMISALIVVAVLASISSAGWEKAVYRAGSSDALPFQLYKPSTYSTTVKYPLVIFFHGAGDRGSDNQSQLTWFPLFYTNPINQAKNPCFVIAPQCPALEQWVNTPWANGTYSQNAIPISAALRKTVGIIDSIAAAYSIDPARIYVTGYSMGGYGSWDLVTRYPLRFAAVNPNCGAGDTSKARLITSLPVWAYHTADDPTVPVSGSREMMAALRAAGGQTNPLYKYTEIATGGHNAWIVAYQDTALYSWFFQQRRTDVTGAIRDAHGKQGVSDGKMRSRMVFSVEPRSSEARLSDIRGRRVSFGRRTSGVAIRTP